MSRRVGFTLVELIVVIAIMIVLTAIALPTFSSVRRRVTMVSCAGRLRTVHQGIMSFVAENNRHLPPFRVSDVSFSLPEAGHWGGPEKPSDTVLLGSFGSGAGGDAGKTFSANMWTLVKDGFISSQALVCPSAPSELRDGRASLFPQTGKFSTYCLRFPYSWDVFRSAPGHKGPNEANLLRNYAIAAGGQIKPTQTQGGLANSLNERRLPRIRIDLRYRISQSVACGDGDYDAGSDALLADGFWQQDQEESSDDSYPLRAAWSHDNQFNVLYGNGAVRTVSDDGNSVAPYTNSPEKQLEDDGFHDATYTEKVWQFFDGKM